MSSDLVSGQRSASQRFLCFVFGGWGLRVYESVGLRVFGRLSRRDQHHEPTGSREDGGRRRQVYAGNSMGPFRPGAHDILPVGGAGAQDRWRATLIIAMPTCAAFRRWKANDKDAAVSATWHFQDVLPKSKW